MTARKEKDRLEDLKAMPDGEEYWWDKGEESGAEVWRKNDRWFLFEVPQFGGYPRYVREFRENQLMDLIHLVEMWT